MSEQQQAVVEDDKGQAKPDPAETDARDDDLETLLKQYDKEVTDRSKSEPETKGAATDPALAEEVKALRNEIANDRYRKDMDALVKDMRGDLDPEIFDDTLVEAWVDAQARADRRLSRAWEERHSNPKGFEKVKAELGRKFTSRFSKMPDRAVTEDRDAVAHAVRGSSTKASEGKAPDYSGLSNNEYREAIKKDFGFDPNV